MAKLFKKPYQRSDAYIRGSDAAAASRPRIPPYNDMALVRAWLRGYDQTHRHGKLWRDDEYKK